MPKASLFALLAAGAVTVTPFPSFAQAAAKPPTGNAPASAEAPADAASPTRAPATAPEAAPDEPTAPDEPAAPATNDETAPSPSADDEPLAPVSEPAPPPAAVGGVMLPGAGLAAAEPAPSSPTKSAQQADDASKDAILAEQWWSHSRPIIEIHGYFRTRAEMFHNLSLGRVNAPEQQLWPKPSDHYYSPLASGGSSAATGANVCGAVNSTTGGACSNKTQSSANLRLRLNPEIHVSDNLRVMTQIDILDNLVLGSTPSGYTNSPAGELGGYQVNQRSGYNPLSFFDNTQEVPSAGINDFKDSVRVKRAWAEYSTPVGQLRFGRMADHFGLGMLHNAGNGYDHDYQTTVDRIMFITDLRPLDLHVGASWDFPSEGATSSSLKNLGGQAYDRAQLDDVDQYSFLVLRRKNPQLERLALTRGDLVFNFGAYLQYRSQQIAADRFGVCSSTTSSTAAAPLGCDSGNVSQAYAKRGAYAWTPDVWGQLLYKGFRFEFEVATIQGKINSTAIDPGSNNYSSAPGGEGWRLNAWGVATQLQQKLVEDKLDLSFGFGWSSGDPNVDKNATALSEAGNAGLTPGSGGLQNPVGSNQFKTFRFHPSYQMDLILHRNLLTRVQGTYYFRPSVGYDFLRKANGQRLGGNVAAIWTRASEYIQAPGHKRDLGIELNGSIYFQSKDGVLNDRPGTLGGFFTMIQYGLLFPMDGLGYPQKMQSPGRSSAQMLRWYLGVFF